MKPAPPVTSTVPPMLRFRATIYRPNSKLRCRDVKHSSCVPHGTRGLRRQRSGRSPQAETGQFGLRTLPCSQGHAGWAQRDYLVLNQSAGSLKGVALAVVPNQINLVAQSSRLFLPVDLIGARAVRFPRGVVLEYGSGVPYPGTFSQPASSRVPEGTLGFG